jgi:FkbM family methyltransferase
MSVNLQTLFSVIYDQEVPSTYVNLLNKIGANNNGSLHSSMRRIIGAIDRQKLSTPLLCRFGAADIVFADVGDFELAIDLADTSVGLSILHTRRYEPHVTAFMREHIRSGMTVIDVGANIGFFTMLASKLVGESGSVFAFEPNSENLRLLLLDIKQNNCGNVRVFGVALSNCMGNAFFSTHVGSNGGLLRNDIEVLQSPQCVVVPTFRMDQLIHERIDLIKIDVEGAEGLVFEGAWHLVETYRPIISSEFSPEMLRRVSKVEPSDYLSRFQALNYRIFLLERDKADGKRLEITDIPRFLGNYGQHTRIEDIAFIPGSECGANKN